MPGVDKGPVYLWSVLFLVIFVLLLAEPLGLAVLALLCIPVGVLASRSEVESRRRYGISLITAGVFSLLVFLCVAVAAIRNGSAEL